MLFLLPLCIHKLVVPWVPQQSLVHELTGIPFLDMLITPDEGGRLNTTVYRKPTHIDQYLHWDSYHAIPSKYSVIGTLFHWAKTICSGPQQLQKEEQHLYKSLKKCKYPTWALNRVKLRSQAPAPKKNKSNIKNSDPNNSRDQKPHIIVPYHQGLSESFKRTCKKYGIEVHLKGGPTIKNLLMAPKDKDPILKKSWVIYRYKCDRVECNEEYIGESARNFAERFKEHLKAKLQYMTTLTHLVILSPLKISVYWEDRTKTSLEPSKKLYT